MTIEYHPTLTAWGLNKAADADGQRLHWLGDALATAPTLQRCQQHELSAEEPAARHQVQMPTVTPSSQSNKQALLYS